MTTIAIDKETIASDSQATGAFIHAKNFTKVHCVPEGRNKGYWGFAGHAINAQQIAEVLVSGYPVDTIDPSLFQDVDAVWVQEDGTVLAFVDSANGMEVHLPFAIGSGSQFAIGALAAGASAKEAVEIAKQLDPYTGKEVIVHHYALEATMEVLDEDDDRCDAARALDAAMHLQNQEFEQMCDRDSEFTVKDEIASIDIDKEFKFLVSDESIVQRLTINEFNSLEGTERKLEEYFNSLSENDLPNDDDLIESVRGNLDEVKSLVRLMAIAHSETRKQNQEEE